MPSETVTVAIEPWVGWLFFLGGLCFAVASYWFTVLAREAADRTDQLLHDARKHELELTRAWVGLAARDTTEDSDE